MWISELPACLNLLGAKFFCHATCHAAQRVKVIPSMPAESRRAFFEERLNPFLTVVGVEALELMLDFPFQRFREEHFVTGKQRLLYCANGYLRTRSDFFRQALYL